MLADGQVELVAEERSGDALVARVTRSGSVGARKGVHLPDSSVEYELPTVEDRELIELAREMGVDFLGVSFVGHARELEEIRGLAPEMQLVAKIERKAALENLDQLIEASDGIMVARGDLGVEMELEEVPVRQKLMIHSAVQAGRFSITATEMLESMIVSSRPTRAEVSDVANAVLDGSDAVMLSAETAVGEYPVEAVRTMNRIARSVEAAPRYQGRPRLELAHGEATFWDAIAKAAVDVANALELDSIVCFTETGTTARLISRFRPNLEIIGLTPNPTTVGQMSVLSNVRPYLLERESKIEEMLYMATEMLVSRGIADYGDQIVFVAGVPPGIAKSTNLLKLHRIGEEIRLS